MRISDWSSDVCSSDLELLARLAYPVQGTPRSRQKSQARGAGSLPHRRDHGLNLRLDLFGAGLHKHLAIDEEGWGAADTDCRSEEHTSELQSLMRISYAVFCLKQ